MSLCIILCPIKFCNHLEEEENAGCFAIIVLQMYCYYECSVTLPLPDGAMDWSAICDVVFPDYTHLLSVRRYYNREYSIKSNLMQGLVLAHLV